MSVHQMLLPDLKAQAKSLRSALAEQGQAVSHSQSLELLAKQHGFRDWNTLHARIGNEPRRGFHLNQRVQGTYLGQPFRGEIIGIRSMASNTRFAVTLRFDAPVDVVTFEGFSNLRSQVHGVVGLAGTSKEVTSDGQPHLRVLPEKP